jgi:hypothetical protein
MTARPINCLLRKEAVDFRSAIFAFDFVPNAGPKCVGQILIVLAVGAPSRKAHRQNRKPPHREIAIR